MKHIRHFINLIESADDQSIDDKKPYTDEEDYIDDNEHVYHGGTYSGGKYDSLAHGEPGNLRPLGKGLYTATTRNHAGRYVKYSGGNGQVHKFKISPTAKIYPWGALTWNKLSPSEADYWRAASDKIQQAFEKAKLLRFNKFTKEYEHWTASVSNSSGGFAAFQREDIRKLLASIGIDGARMDFDDNFAEIVFYNTDVLIPVK